MKLDAAEALGHLPQSLRQELVDEYTKIARNYREGRWESAELDGGRLCEIAFSILRGYVDGAFPERAAKPSNFPKACEQLAQASKDEFPQSARVGIPRVLIGLYEIRNNRGVGHVGGDVDANHMDATFVLHAAQWIVAELVRLFHGTDVQTATSIVDALVDRTLPMLWHVGDVTRVLQTDLTLEQQTLVLLYAEPDGVPVRVLMRNLEQERLSNYQRVLGRLHNRRAVEYDRSTGVVTLSPVGVKAVEDQLLPREA